MAGRDPAAEAHEHEWEPVGVIDHETVLYSPVSAMDHVLVTQKLAVRSCKCGAVRRTEVGRKERWLNR
jgi:hypothetical protein